MLDGTRRGPGRDDHDLCVRAAWLHYGAGMTQSEVAARLGVPSLKAHRLIAKANKEGLVRISIEGDIIECVRLEEKMRARFALQFCEVCPDLDDELLPVQTLSLAGSRFLRLAFENGEEKVIGFGHGRRQFGREIQPSGLHIGGDERIEPRLKDGNFATVKRGDLALILVDAGDLMTEIRKAGA